MKLKRMISLLLMLVITVAAAGTVTLAAEGNAAYEPVESFQVSTDEAPMPYIMGIGQPNEPGQPYYFLKGGGTTSGIEGYTKTSMPTTAKAWESTPVYIEQVENGYRMYYMKGENKSYLAITSGGVTNNQKDQTDAKNTFTWDAENKVFYQMDQVHGDSEPVKYILAITLDETGTPRNRFTAERWDDYMAGATADGRTVYPVKLFTSEAVGLRAAVEVDETPVTVPEVGKPYFFCVRQEDKGENGTLYYWIGRVVDTKAALFLETTTDNGKAAVVFLEKTDSGWKMTQMLDGEKQYLYLYRKDSDMALGLVKEAKYATNFQWDDQYNTLVADYFGTAIFMGVNTDMNDDGTVKTAYTKFKPLKTTVLGAEHRFASFLIAVPDSVQTELPPGTETEPQPTDADFTDNGSSIPAPKSSHGTSTAGIIVAVVLMVCGAALVILDLKKKPRDQQS